MYMNCQMVSELARRLHQIPKCQLHPKCHHSHQFHQIPPSIWKTNPSKVSTSKHIKKELNVGELHHMSTMLPSFFPSKHHEHHVSAHMLYVHQHLGTSKPRTSNTALQWTTAVAGLGIHLIPQVVNNKDPWDGISTFMVNVGKYIKYTSPMEHLGDIFTYIYYKKQLFM